RWRSRRMGRSPGRSSSTSPAPELSLPAATHRRRFRQLRSRSSIGLAPRSSTPPRYGGGMTTFDLRTLRIRSGDQARERVEIELEPLVLGGQTYEPQPNPVPAELAVTRASSGTVPELALQLRLREYQAAKPEGEEERTEYLEDDRVDLSAWARDAIALALPDQILCRPDCAGLCPVCGKDLNAEPHEHVEERLDPRWAKLSELRQE